MTVLILHGVKGYAGKHWMQWLADHLAELGHQIIMPTFPNADHPDRQEWLAEVSQLLKDINLTELIMIGHSLGNATILDFLEQQAQPVFGFISVAGFYRTYRSELNDYFMSERNIDMSKVKKNIKKSFVIFGDDDPYVPQSELNALAKALGVQPLIIPGGGHLNTDARFITFPTLLAVVRSIGAKKTY